MANNELHIDIAENQVRVPLSVRSRSLLRTVTPDDGNPYYVGARAYVTQDEDGATITIIDKDGTTTAVVENGTDGQDGATGNGIASIELTSTSGNVDTYTITYDNGDTDGFTVTNGVDGQNGADGTDGYSPTATVEKVGTTSTITITDINGTTTAEVYDGAGGASAFVAEFNVTPYADVKDAYDDGAIIICTADDSGNTMIFQLAYYDDANSIFYFAESSSDGWAWASIGSDDTWDNGYFLFASTDTATQLRDGLMSALDKQKLDGLSKRNIWYGTCSTGASNSPKTITTASGDFSLTAGSMLVVKFSTTNSLSSASLQVDGGTSKSVYSLDGSSDIANRWGSGEVVMFAYDGTKFILLEQGKASTTAYGITKLNNTTNSTSTSEAATANAVKAAYDNGGVQSVNGNTGAVTVTVPTKVSDLSNDSGFISSETDPVFTASAAHGISSSDITAWNGKSDFSGSYTDLTDKPTIPSNTSDLNNDSGFTSVSLTRHTTTGTNIADLTIDGTTTKLYAPTGGGGGITDVEVDGTSVVTGTVAEIDLTGKSDVGHTHTKSAITDFPTLATVATSGSYNDLSNKPTIPIVPTNVSDFVNDAGYLTTETDPVFTASDAYGIDSSDISSWNGKAEISDIPTNVSDLVNDSGFITGYTETDPVFGASAAAGISSSDISNWNGKSDFSGSYDDLTNKPTIPSDTGDLTNGAGFIASSAFLVENVEISSGSINAATAENFTKDISKAGYTPLGIVGIRKTGQTYGAVSISRFNLDLSGTPTAYVSIYNNYSSPRTYTVSADILYIKN